MQLMLDEVHERESALLQMKHELASLKAASHGDQYACVGLMNMANAIGQRQFWAAEPKSSESEK